MHTLASLLAFSWQPEIRGISTVVIGIVVLMGSVYLLLGTNLGSRLGFLVSLAGLFGWMFLMGIIWWAYGIGLKGADASWKPEEIIVEFDQAKYADVVGGISVSGTTVDAPGWRKLAEDDPRRGQAVSSADEILINKAKYYKAGDYEPVAVFETGGKRWPMLFGREELDFLAFKREARYSLVQVQPLLKQATEPGKAPPRPVADSTQPPRFVLMIRDLGNERVPAALITIFSGLVFGATCVMLHRRDRLVAANRSAGLAVAKA
jgi:hypothetical protein